MRSSVRLMCCSLLASATGGCIVAAVAVVAAAVAVGTYSYVNNELQRDYKADFDRAWEASRKTVRDLGFHDIRESRDFQRGIVEARRSDEAPVRVVVDRKDSEHVHIGVRVGAFESQDNKSAAQAIHERILSNTGG